MHFPRQRQEEVSVNLTPLIDVVFLLLIFFMVSTTFTKQTRLAITLPEAKGQPQVQEKNQVEVVVTQSGDYVVNGKQLVHDDEATLRSALMQAAKNGTDVPFTITADAKATHQSVVRVMDVAGQLGFTNLNITTREPGKDSGH